MGNTRHCEAGVFLDRIVDAPRSVWAARGAFVSMPGYRELSVQCPRMCQPQLGRELCPRSARRDSSFYQPSHETVQSNILCFSSGPSQTCSIPCVACQLLIDGSTEERLQICCASNIYGSKDVKAGARSARKVYKRGPRKSKACQTLKKFRLIEWEAPASCSFHFEL